MCTWRKWQDPTIWDLMVAVSTCWAISTIYMYMHVASLTICMCFYDSLSLNIIIYHYESIIIYQSVYSYIHQYIYRYVYRYVYHQYLYQYSFQYLHQYLCQSVYQSINLSTHPSIQSIYYVCATSLYQSYDSLKQMYNMIDFNMSLA